MSKGGRGQTNSNRSKRRGIKGEGERDKGGGREGRREERRERERGRGGERQRTKS